MTKIIREGFFFRAVNEATGFKSSLLSSASQAGKLIERKFGKDAHHDAAEAYIASVKKTA